jgi:hypothetical protein
MAKKSVNYLKMFFFKDYAKLNQALFNKYSKTFQNELKIDNDNKLNNNYILPITLSTPTLPSSFHHQQQQEFILENQSQSSQRKRHANEEHPGEPRSKIIC